MRVLVTGCGGFLGSEIVRQLLARGDQVLGVARRRYPELESLGMQPLTGDLCDPVFVRSLTCGCDAVIHTAAKAGVWGAWDDYFRINTAATNSLLDVARQSRVRWFVYSSSPSVTFDGNHQRNIDESAPYPSRYMCAYPHTKAIAEQAVLAANQPGSFETVALRPHLIWGNDDPHLLPRLVERARLGRLRIVGDGLNRVDTVHVANAAAAHLDALDALVSQPRESSGHAYFIAQDESVLCWDWIRQICELADVAPPHQRISYRSAYRLGTMLEWIYRVLGRKNEPPMTRFVAAQLATDHYFNITRAREQLQYRVRVSLAEGLAELSQGGRWRKSPAKTL